MDSDIALEDRFAEADRRLRASHERLDRECVRAASRMDSETLSLSVAGNRIVYSYRGVRHPVTWFDLLTFGESLKSRGMIRSFDTVYPCIVFAMDDTARTTLLGYASPLDIAEDEIADLEVPEIQVNDPAPPQEVEAVHPRSSGSLPKAIKIMQAVLEALLDRPLARAEVLEAAGRVLEYPLSKAHAGEVPTDGVSVKRTMDRIFSILVREGLVVRDRKSFSVTVTARINLAQGIDLGLKCDPVMKSDQVNNASGKKDKKPKATGLGRMSHEALVSMWKNALKVLADPLKKKAHDRARSVVVKVTTEWELRTRTESGYFKWPTTEAKGGNGKLSMFDAEKEGMLSFLEYRVGRVKGEPQGVRRMILRRVFEGSLPPVFSKDYMSQWGANASPERLHKMAVSIAAFARNFKRRRSASYDDAIRDWEADLKFLRVTYYVGKFGFGWPVTAI